MPRSPFGKLLGRVFGACGIEFNLDTWTAKESDDQLATPVKTKISSDSCSTIGKTFFPTWHLLSLLQGPRCRSPVTLSLQRHSCAEVKVTYRTSKVKKQLYQVELYLFCPEELLPVKTDFYAQLWQVVRLHSPKVTSIIMLRQMS